MPAYIVAVAYSDRGWDGVDLHRIRARSKNDALNHAAAYYDEAAEDFQILDMTACEEHAINTQPAEAA